MAININFTSIIIPSDYPNFIRKVKAEYPEVYKSYINDNKINCAQPLNKLYSILLNHFKKFNPAAEIIQEEKIDTELVEDKNEELRKLLSSALQKEMPQDKIYFSINDEVEAAPEQFSEETFSESFIKTTLVTSSNCVIEQTREEFFNQNPNFLWAKVYEALADKNTNYEEFLLTLSEEQQQYIKKAYTICALKKFIKI